MTYESMEFAVNNFIDSELMDMQDYPECYQEEDIEENTKKLKSLNKEDITHISNEILDDNELADALNEALRYYVYHYRREN